MRGGHSAGGPWGRHSQRQQEPVALSSAAREKPTSAPQKDGARMASAAAALPLSGPSAVRAGGPGSLCPARHRPFGWPRSCRPSEGTAVPALPSSIKLAME